MQARIVFRETAPELYRAMLELTQSIDKSCLPKSLLNLVYLRASQINGCAHCIDMHAKECRADGESEQRVYLLDAWAEAPFYTERERAALAWTEAVTQLPDRSVSDAVYQMAVCQFNSEELATLTVAIAEINAWNRINIALRTVAGSYKPVRRATPSASRVGTE